jgi:hypothetical protein
VLAYLGLTIGWADVFLKGRVGDATNLLCCFFGRSAAGFNVRKLLNLLDLGTFSRALLVFRRFCRHFVLFAKFSVFAPPIFCRN